MTEQDDFDALVTIGQAIRSVVKNWEGPDPAKGVCLFTSSVGYLVLREMGVHCRRVDAEAEAYGPLVESLRRVSWPNHDALLDAMHGIQPVYIGPENVGHEYPYHQVLLVEDEWLLDADAGQMSRPIRGYDVPAVVVARVRDHHATYVLPNGGKVNYRLFEQVTNSPCALFRRDKPTMVRRVMEMLAAPTAA